MATIYQHHRLDKKKVSQQLRAGQPITMLIDTDGNNVILLSEHLQKQQQLLKKNKRLKLFANLSALAAVLSLSVVIWVMM